MVQGCEQHQRHYQEANFDGLVGPTHHYAGLALGNVASQKHALQPANPKMAALQGLAKMRTVQQLGIPQGVLPPKPCPDLNLLRSLGFYGNTAQILEQTYQQAPCLLSALYSSASMWVANAATLTPSCDSTDGKVHLSPANLTCQFHRSLEAEHTAALLKTIFANERYFTHHSPLPSHPLFGDEGAANHTRLNMAHGERALQLFVYGQDHQNRSSARPSHYPARQSKQACEAIIRRHRLDPNQCMLLQQAPDVIDQGVFHNDVIAVGNNNVLLYHQRAFLQPQQVQDHIQSFFAKQPLYLIEVTERELSLTRAIESYLFNSQLLTLPDGSMALLAPNECQTDPHVVRFLNQLIQQEQPIKQVHYFDLKQSMRNGGGPACLRLRVVLSAEEIEAVNPNYWLTESRYEQLCQWINKHYRDRLTFDDLRDPLLYQEVQNAFAELATMMQKKQASQIK